MADDKVSERVWSGLKCLCCALHRMLATARTIKYVFLLTAFILAFILTG